MLSIGQFSKTCCVTVKTLRHYEKIGLLLPRQIDPNSGYRYYDTTQIPDMLLIHRLKRYGLSLAEIRTFLSLPDKQARFYALEAQKYRLQKHLTALQETLDALELYLRQLEGTEHIMAQQNNYTIALEETQPKPILSTRQIMSIDDFGKYYGNLFKRITDEKIKNTGLSFAVYHDEEFDPKASDVEVGFFLTDEAQATRLLPGGLCATTTHIGGYSGLPEAYAAVVTWIEENGYEIVNAPYEIYLRTQFDRIPVSELETKVYFPVRKK